MYPNSLGAAAYEPVRYMFIDGNALRMTLSEVGAPYLYKGLQVPLNWNDLAGRCRKAFYYDAIPARKHGETEPDHAIRTEEKRKELEAIMRQPRFHVRTGDAHESRSGRNQQKMVDVQLAVDALLMASRGLFQACTLVASDLDFKPLISALVDMGVDVELLYQKGHTSPKLIEAADRARAIDIEDYRQWAEWSFNAHFPRAQMESCDGNPEKPDRTVYEWEAPGGGRSFIYDKSHAIGVFVGFGLTTSRFRGYRHRLVGWGHTIEALRTYCREQWQFEIPEFQLDR